MTGVLRRVNSGTETHRENAIKTGTDWRDAVVSQGMPRIAARHQKLAEARKYSSLRPSEEVSCPFCGTLLQQ